MQISTDTITMLKNYASINANLVVTDDGYLKTISKAKNILAKSKNKVDIANANYGIYDLNEFLSTLQLIPNGELEVINNSYIELSEHLKSVRYGLADPNILTAPTKEVTMPDADVQIEITNEQLSELRKAASVLGNDTLRISAGEEDEFIKLSVVDSNGATANVFEIEMQYRNAPKGDAFSFDFLINNLKVLPGNYEVSLSSKLISQWEGEEITYWIALEKTSKYED